MKPARIFIVAVILSTMVASPGSGESQFLYIPEGGTMAVYSRGSGYFVLRQEKVLNAALLGTIRKLSSGLRIVTPSDDPAGFAVAENMKKIILEIQARSAGEEDLRNYLKYIESALGHSQTVMARMRELVLRASGGIYGPDDREIVQTEIDQLMLEIDANAAYAEFNRKRVIPELTASALGLRAVDVVNNYMMSLEALDRAMERVMKMRALAGTRDNVLEFRIKGRSFYYVNLQGAESRIRDLDMAEEISGLIKNHTLLRFEYGVILKGK